MRIKMLVFLSMCAITTVAQQLRVLSFKIDPMDVSASTERRVDDKGNPCALIKVQIAEKIIQVNGEIVGNIIDHGMEKWIYVRSGTNQLVINPENSSPVTVNFANYQLNAAKGLLTYKMIISDLSSAGESKYREGEHYVGQKQYNEALPCFLESADGGYASAYSALAMLYYNGWGVDKDMNKTIEYLRMGADANDSNSLYMLGTMILKGDGVKKEPSKGAGLLEKAAQLGQVNAQFEWGQILLAGTFSNRDIVKGREWIAKAAEQGLREAQFVLGELYCVGGGGLEKDIEQSIMWIKKAADQDYVMAIPSLAYIYELLGDGEKAVEYYKKGAILEEPQSMIAIGAAYIEGKWGLERDYTKAFQLLKKAEKTGIASGVSLLLSICYENGWGTAKNKKLARQYQEKGEQEVRDGRKNLRDLLGKMR